MAFLTESNFYLVTFKPTSAPEWGVLDHMPILSTDALGAVVSGDPHLVFVTEATSGSFAEEGFGPGCSGVSDTVLASAVGPLPLHVLEVQNGATHYFGRLPDGDVARWGGGHELARISDAAKDLLVAFLAA